MRFTCWLSPKERAALEREAQRQQATKNYVIRVALRQYLKMDELSKEPQNYENVTAVTGN